MRNRRKVILGVALSFMILFTCVGYAALNDTLSISGSMSATAPEELYITEIAYVSDLDLNASIAGYTSTSATITAAMTAANPQRGLPALSLIHI